MKLTAFYIFNEFKKLLGSTSVQALTADQKRRLSKRTRVTLRRRLRDIMFILFGVVSAGFGLKSFLIPNGFIDGGVTGISLLVNTETKIPLSILILVLNFPFMIIAWKQINSTFSIKSVIAITMLSIAVLVIPYPKITDDKLLVSVFGGFFLGAGIGLTIRGGAVIDGTEVLAIFFSRKNSMTVGDFILIFNILIFSVAAYLLSIPVALYSILTYLAASKTVDFILEGIEEYTGVTIISSRSKQIADMIHNRMGRGLTIYSGKKGYGKRGESNVSTDIIFTVITRLEINRLTNEVEKIDRNAFITMQKISDTRGGMVKKKSLPEH